MVDWRDLVQLSDSELAKVDVAEINLACAVGLPGPEVIDVAGCLERLHQWTKRVRHGTNQLARQFERNREEYGDSWAQFRVLVMATVLRDVGLRYNPASKPEDASLHAEDVFIHGAVLAGGGTCASIPVVYAAIGRRLGYPIKLVPACGHLFCRWDEPHGERFNFEVNDTGFSSQPDNYYRTWPKPFTAWQEKAGGWLKSQSPRQELANFLAQRAYLWVDFGNLPEAIATFEAVSRVSPELDMYSSLAKGFQNLPAHQFPVSAQVYV